MKIKRFINVADYRFLSSRFWETLLLILRPSLMSTKGDFKPSEATSSQTMIRVGFCRLKCVLAALVMFPDVVA